MKTFRFLYLPKTRNPIHTHTNNLRMRWYNEDEYEDEEEDLMFSPALLARRASESWIIAPPVEVHADLIFFLSKLCFPNFVFIFYFINDLINPTEFSQEYF